MAKTRKRWGRSRRWCWKREWCVGKALCNPPVWMYARVRMRRRPSYTLLQVSPYLLISLSRSVWGALPICLSRSHFLPLHHRLFPFYHRCLSISSSCNNDNPVLISSLPAFVVFRWANTSDGKVSKVLWGRAEMEAHCPPPLAIGAFPVPPYCRECKKNHKPVEFFFSPLLTGGLCDEWRWGDTDSSPVARTQPALGCV